MLPLPNSIRERDREREREGEGVFPEQSPGCIPRATHDQSEEQRHAGCLGPLREDAFLGSGCVYQNEK